MQPQFTLPRLIGVLAALAAAFALAGPLGPLGFLPALAMAIPVSGIILVVKRRDAGPILLSLFWCWMGFLAGGLLGPIHDPGEEIGAQITRELLWAAASVLAGWSFGQVVALLDKMRQGGGHSKPSSRDVS